MGIDVLDGAGELGEVGLFGGLPAEEELEGGDADAAAVVGALLEDGQEVGGAEEADDALDVAGGVEVCADGAFEFFVAIGDADEGGEVSTGGAACDDDAGGIDAEGCLLGAEEAEGCLDIVDLGWEGGLGGEAVIDAGDGEAFMDEWGEWAVALRAAAPGAAVDVDEEGRAGLFGKIKVEGE